MKIKKGQVERLPKKYSEELQRVVEWSLNTEQDKRPTIEDMLNLPQVSMRLREKRIKEHSWALKKKEDELRARDLELNAKAE